MKRESASSPDDDDEIDPLVGTTIQGKYHLTSIVASGGMGRIYRAEQVALGRAVAIKVMLHRNDRRASDTASASRGTESFQKRFFLEASILSKLQHPNIVTIFDYGSMISDAGAERLYMVMEYLDGETLQRRLRNVGKLSIIATIHVAMQIALGLCEAHAHGVVHRDLKPSNLMLVTARDRETRVKIVDFGIGKVLVGERPGGEEITQDGILVGSPSYLAPEQIGDGEISFRTDMYSYGIILYQCICGHLPYEAESAGQLLVAHLQQKPIPMRVRTPGLEVPTWLEELVMRCLEKEPAHRPASMEEVLRLLEEHAPNFSTTSGSGPRARADLSPTSSGANVALLSGGVKIASSGTILTVVPAPAFAATDAAGVDAALARGPAPVTGAREKQPLHARSHLPALLAIGVLLVVVALLVGRAAVTSTALPAAGAAASSTPAALAPEPRRSFSLVLDSVPPGAEVMEGDRSLGTTPIQLSLENAALRLAPRTFSVRRAGYVPYSVVQGPSEDSVRVIAALVAAPAPSSAPADGASDGHPLRVRRPGPAAPPLAASANVRPAPASSLEIRFDR